MPKVKVVLVSRAMVPMAEPESPMDMPTFFHTILFAYQKRLKEILGSGEAIFVHPVLETISLIEKEKGLNLIQGETLDEIYENFSKQLLKTKIVEKALFEKLAPKKYVFHVEGCAFGKFSHDLLKPKDVICPFALIAMSIFQSATGKKVKITDSEFTPDGTKTLIT
jgi:hypothetical protein